MAKMDNRIATPADLFRWLDEIKIEKESHQGYETPEDCRYANITLEHNESYFDDEDGYCWSLTSRWSITHQSGYIFPMVGSSDMVKTFKTIGGCKRNLKRYLEQFDDRLFVGEMRGA